MKKVIVVGGGPAGLMAADVLSAAGVEVHLYDAMPSVGRKFLLAGKGGLNLTHSEPADIFASRYGARRAHAVNVAGHENVPQQSKRPKPGEQQTQLQRCGSQCGLEVRREIGEQHKLACRIEQGWESP